MKEKADHLRRGDTASGRMGENGAFEDEDDDEYENEARSRYLLFEAVIGSRPLAVMAWVAAAKPPELTTWMSAARVSAEDRTKKATRIGRRVKRIGGVKGEK
jgi:hypothetical protein